MKKSFLYLAVCFFGFALGAGFCEFAPEVKIKIAEYGGTATSAAGSELYNGIKYDVETVRLEAFPEKKLTYCGVEVRFPEPLNFSDFTSVELLARAEKPTALMLVMLTDKGIVSAPYRKKLLSGTLERFSFDRAEFKSKFETDFTKIYGFIVGFGLWNYNTCTDGQTVAFGDLRVVTPDNRYIVPRPTAAVSIDGDFRKDWGYENNLYIWTPPVFFR